MIQHIQTFFGKDNGLPVVWRIVDGQREERSSVCSWLAERRPEIDAILNSQGALLIRGFTGLKTAVDFEQAITSISPQLRDYVGGTSPRENVHGKIMTATYVPPSWSIPLHQEMAYTANPPDRIAFFCVQPAMTGGHSTIGDMRMPMMHIAPEIRKKFQTHGLQLRRTLPSPQTIDQKPGVKKPWTEVFGVTKRTQADDIAQAKGWRTQWLDGDALQLWQEILPATKTHLIEGSEVWFNQAHFFAPACMMAWAKRDGRMEDCKHLAHARNHHPEMLDDIFLGNGEPVSDDEALHIAQVLQALEIPVQLETSDLLILDNILIAHGRTAFSGTREILVALVNVPESSQPRRQ